MDSGLAKTVSSRSIWLTAPTLLIEKPLETQRIDGVDIGFELTRGAEVPAEPIMYHPQFRMLNMTKITSRNMHDLLPMPGAQVCDAQEPGVELALHRRAATAAAESGQQRADACAVHVGT